MKLKRSIDIIVALLALIVTSPILLITALLIRLKLGSPILFSQERPGLNGRIFRLYKFRSMLDSAGPDGEQLPDDKRLTQFGRTLRSTSIDELPALLNVLFGDMSLVGPRPLLKEYLPLYSEEQSRRHDVKPGITGWAQVHGRNLISWENKFELDVWYVDNQSFSLDCKILLKTVFSVLNRDGVTLENRATPTKFQGSSNIGKSNADM